MYLLTDALLPYLKSQFEITEEKDSYVFLNAKDKPFWDISKIREGQWTKDLKRAGVEYRKIHNTRHTFCSTIEIYSKYIPRDIGNFGKSFNNI